MYKHDGYLVHFFFFLSWDDEEGGEGAGALPQKSNSEPLDCAALLKLGDLLLIACLGARLSPLELILSAQN